jgi:hypothetical protein
MAGVGVFSATSVAGVPHCDKRPPKNAIIADIPLTGPRLDEAGTPLFYVYATDGWNRIYARPRDVIQTIDDMLAETEAGTGPGNAASLRSLAAEISKDLPLSDHTDLGKYALRATGLDITTSYVISDLLKRGRVSIGTVDYFRGPGPFDPPRIATVRMVALGNFSSVWSRLYCAGPVQLYYMQYQIP